MKRGTKLLCIKQMEDYREENGIDFIQGKEYEIESYDKGEIYVESEDGSSVLFDVDVDFYEYFKLAA